MTIRIEPASLEQSVRDRFVLTQINYDHELEWIEQDIGVSLSSVHDYIALKVEVFDHSLECLLSYIGCEHRLVVSSHAVEASTAE